MAKTRTKKTAEAKAMAQDLRESKSIVFADLSALKVADSTDLRRRAKDETVSIRTAKKTLLRIALKDAGVAEVDVDALAGGVSMLAGRGDEIAPARILEAFRKNHESVKALGGLFESKWMTAEQVRALAALPSRPELIAQLIGSIRAPLAGFVGVLCGNLRGLVRVLGAIKDSKTA